jgi:hypothetical protein
MDRSTRVRVEGYLDGIAPGVVYQPSQPSPPQPSNSIQPSAVSLYFLATVFVVQWSYVATNQAKLARRYTQESVVASTHIIVLIQWDSAIQFGVCMQVAVLVTRLD